MGQRAGSQRCPVNNVERYPATVKDPTVITMNPAMRETIRPTRSPPGLRRQARAIAETMKQSAVINFIATDRRPNVFSTSIPNTQPISTSPLIVKARVIIRRLSDSADRRNFNKARFGVSGSIFENRGIIKHLPCHQIVGSSLPRPRKSGHVGGAKSPKKYKSGSKRSRKRGHYRSFFCKNEN
jgi:hypothetical protein